MLKRLLTKQEAEAWGFPGSDKAWREYIGKATYWEHVSYRARDIIVEVREGAQKKDTWMAPIKYFREMQQEHISLAFADQKKELTPTMNPAQVSFFEATV